MLDEYYDLQKNISKLIEDNNQESEKIQNLLEENLFQIEKPTRKTDNLNNYLSNIKKQLLKKGYLDYINKPNYKLFEEIRKEIYNEEFVFFSDFISLEFEKLKTNFLRNENLIFYHILKKIKDNKYLIFLVNFDFIEKGIQINYQNVIDVYYEKNQKKISEEEMKFQIENLKIKNEKEEDLIEEIHKKYNIFEDRKNEYSSQIENLLTKINDCNILGNKVNLIDILKHENDFFLKGINESKRQLEGLISEFLYENEIQEFINMKYNFTKKINMKNNEIIDLKSRIINEDFEKKNLELKEYEYSIRELYNSNLQNNNENLNIENNSNKLEEKFHSKNHIEVIKIKNEIKKIKSNISNIKDKQNEILQKMESYKKDTKRNTIIKNRFQKIIDKYQNEINDLKIEIEKREKIILDKNDLANTNLFVKENSIKENSIKEKDKIQVLIDEIRKEKDKKYSNLEEEKRIINNYNIEIETKIKCYESEIKNLKIKLNNLKLKYSNKFIIYEDYKNKLNLLNECLKGFTEIKILRDFLLRNNDDFKSEIQKFNSKQEYVLESIKNMGKTKNFWFLIEEAIILIKILGILLENQKIYNSADVETKKEFFYFNLLEYLDSLKSYGENDIYEDKFLKYNILLRRNLYNMKEREKIEEISIDLKKMIYILQ